MNPLNFFEIGSQIGRVNSPAAGPAQMIRSVLQDAQKKGLIQAQSDAQLGQAQALHQFKVDNPMGAQTKNVNIINPQTGETIKRFENQPKEDQFSLPSIPTPLTPAQQAVQDSLAKQFGVGGGAQPQPQTQPQTQPQHRPYGYVPEEIAQAMGGGATSKPIRSYSHTPEEIESARSLGAVAFDSDQGAYVNAQRQPIDL